MRKGMCVFFLIWSVTAFSNAKIEDKDSMILERSKMIHERVLTIDTHTDTPLMLRSETFDIGKRNDPKKRGGKVDFPRMKEGGLDAVFFAVFVGQGERTEEEYLKAKENALAQFRLIRKAVSDNPDVSELAFGPEDAGLIEKKGKRAVFIGMENGYPLGRDLSLVQMFYNLGARYITLCHTMNNDICDSSTDRKGEEHRGLSKFGREVVKEMNRAGMIVDVSHISDRSFYDVLEVSKAPVIASHSCARAICDNPRNLTDDMLEKIAKKGGVVQLCILSEYIKTPPPYPERDKALGELRAEFENYASLTDSKKEELSRKWQELNRKFPRELASVSEAVDHIDHIVKVAGIDHVGIGTDFDGGGALSDCFDSSELWKITCELVRRGYKEEDIRKIWGGNFLRVFRAVEKQSETYSSTN